MKTVRHLASAAAVIACPGAIALASAAAIAPAGASFTAPGTITVRLPASMQLAVTCEITFSGEVSADGSSASITSASVGGPNRLCALARPQNLPWTLTPLSDSVGTVSGVAFGITGRDCGPDTIEISWSNASNTLSATNQALSGNCTIDRLSVQPDPAFSVSR